MFVSELDFNWSSEAPAALPMAFVCINSNSSDAIPGPAIAIINFTFVFSDATMGAIIPPSLWPIKPIVLNPFWTKNVTAALVSRAKSCVVTLFVKPSEPPVPLSSIRKTPIPFLAKSSAITQKD